jgi:redox-sensitive bicupin YhaK (pirin superfamily)
MSLTLHTLPSEPLVIGKGFKADGIRGAAAMMDPYLMIDHFRMTEPTFGPHPHAGFSAVTYLFADSTTDTRNRDTSGDDSLIHPGDAHWMVAGSGMVHDEVPVVNGKLSHGLQLFVKLPAKDQYCTPHPLKIRDAQMPRLTQASGAVTKLAWGSYDDGEQQAQVSVAVPTASSLLEVNLAAKGRFTYPLATLSNMAIAIVVQGTARFSTASSAAKQLNTSQAVAIECNDTLIIESDQAAQVVLLLGTPLGEPVFQHGPFALSTRAQVVQAINDYQAGKMGHLEPL